MRVGGSGEGLTPVQNRGGSDQLPQKRGGGSDHPLRKRGGGSEDPSTTLRFSIFLPNPGPGWNVEVGGAEPPQEATTDAPDGCDISRRRLPG